MFDSNANNDHIIFKDFCLKRFKWRNMSLNANKRYLWIPCITCIMTLTQDEKDRVHPEAINAILQRDNAFLLRR